MKKNKEENYINITRKARLHSLLVYIILAMQAGDIDELADFEDMWPVIKKDLQKLNKLHT